MSQGMAGGMPMGGRMPTGGMGMHGGSMPSSMSGGMGGRGSGRMPAAQAAMGQWAKTCLGYATSEQCLANNNPCQFLSSSTGEQKCIIDRSKASKAVAIQLQTPGTVQSNVEENAEVPAVEENASSEVTSKLQKIRISTQKESDSDTDSQPLIDMWPYALLALVFVVLPLCGAARYAYLICQRKNKERDVTLSEHLSRPTTV